MAMAASAAAAALADVVDDKLTTIVQAVEDAKTLMTRIVTLTRQDVRDKGTDADGDWVELSESPDDVDEVEQQFLGKMHKKMEGREQTATADEPSAGTSSRKDNDTDRASDRKDTTSDEKNEWTHMVTVKTKLSMHRNRIIAELRNVAPPSDCDHPKDTIIRYGNQHGTGIKCGKCELKVFKKKVPEEYVVYVPE